LSQDCTVDSGVRRLNGTNAVERDSPPPGTFPRKMAGPRQQNGKQFQAPHGVFIPDEASDVSAFLGSDGW